MGNRLYEYGRRGAAALATGGHSEAARTRPGKAIQTGGLSETKLGSDVGSTLSGYGKKINPFDTTKSDSINQDAVRNAGEQYDKSQPILGRMNDADKQYQDMYKVNSSKYKSDRDNSLNSYLVKSAQLRDEAAKQGTSAQATYTNDIQPRLKSNMESAMSLKDAGDPNNSVHTAVRGMYNQQGENVRKQGQQDFGVLSALGAQSAGQQFGAGAPMTAGMMGQIYSQNQSQAGNAYANAQKRMYDLQQQGIDRGFDESAAQYDRGRTATNDFIGAEGEYLNRGRDSRAELNAYDSDRMGVQTGRAGENMDLDMGYAGIGRDNAYGQGERDLGALGQYYGTQQSIIGNRADEEAARQAGKGQMIQGLGGAAARYYGGAA